MFRLRVAVPRSVPLAVLVGLVLAATAAGLSLGYFLKLDLPDVRALEDYTPPLMTRVLARDGSLLGTFAEQRRMLVAYTDIPQVFRDALVAAEDARFDRHTGVDLAGIARAAWHDVLRLRLAQGASTITQQLARGLFLHPQKLWRRKAQELLLALEIERAYSKQEILTFYCNQVYMGHGQYGIEAASRYFFGKPARDLDLPEAALLAGIVQRPESLSPYRNPERALERRNYVLTRMREEGFLSPEGFEEASRTPLGLAVRRPEASPAPYFVEEVRRWLQARLGDESLYQSGHEVRTTLDPALQAAANRAVDAGLRELDKRQGWRGVERRVPPGQDPATWEEAAWQRGVAAGEVTDGVVLSEAPGGGVVVRVGPFKGLLEPEDAAWTGRSRPASFLRPGDVVQVRVESAGEGRADVSLEQEPLVEAALLAIEPGTGAIRALVGGRDYGRSEFDRAIQARRQAGSAFKPLVFAAALTRGRTAADTVLDEPTVLLDTRTLEPYQPENYEGVYYGTMTLRRALEKSDNIATVKLLTEIGAAPVIDLARALGITTELQPYPSMALGAFEVSLLELTTAYGTFANQGVRVDPHFVDEVVRRDGTMVERAEPAVHDAISPQTAYLVNRMLQGVILEGTGRAAASLGRPLAGKTGTTDDFTDAWFIGYTPDLVVGVWVGHDLKKRLGSGETGARAALPIWMAFMEEASSGLPAEDFARPPGVVEVAVDRESGLRANPGAGCQPVFAESFLEGTEPTRYCSAAEHARLAFPIPFQRYPLNELGELVIPSWALDELLASEPAVRSVAGGGALETVTGRGIATLAVKRIFEPRPDALPPAVAGKLAEANVSPGSWVGRDGRLARVLLVE